jgi:hypothetical protein
MCKILANRTQVSDVAPGPLDFCLFGFFFFFGFFCFLFCFFFSLLMIKFDNFVMCLGIRYLFSRQRFRYIDLFLFMQISKKYLSLFYISCIFNFQVNNEVLRLFKMIQIRFQRLKDPSLSFLKAISTSDGK